MEIVTCVPDSSMSLKAGLEAPRLLKVTSAKHADMGTAPWLCDTGWGLLTDKSQELPQPPVQLRLRSKAQILS